jgi:FlaA1/EpsC-like NDP-sugar epimerase
MLDFVLSLTRRKKRVIFLSLDLVLLPLVVIFSFGLLYGANNAFQLFTKNLPHTGMLLCVAVIMSLVLGLPRIRLKAFDSSAIAKVGTFASVLCLASIALDSLATLELKTAFHVSFGILFFLVSAGSRMLLFELLLMIYRGGKTRSSILIYGAGRTGMQLASALKSDPNVRPVGFVDDNRALFDQIVAGLPVYGGFQLDEVLQDLKPDRIVIAMPSADRPTIARLERRLARSGAEVQVVPSFAQLIGTDDPEVLISKAAPGTFLGRDQLDKRIDLGSDQYVDRVVMVSGAGGSIGSELTRQVMHCNPSKLILFEMSELALYQIDMELRDSAAQNNIEIVSVLGSVDDGPLVERILNQHSVDIVLHAAAYKHVPLVELNPVQGLANNVLGTLTLATKSRDAGVKRFVLVSSDKAVRPANIMGASKRFAEIIVQDLSTRSNQTVFSIVRFGNVLGSSGSVIPLFQDQVSRGGPVTLTHDDVTRFFMTVQEAAQLVLTAGSLADGGEVFVLDMGQPISVRKLAEQVIEAAGYSLKSIDNPLGDIEIQTVGLRPGEKLHEELLIGTGRMTTRHEKIFSVHEETLSEIEVASALKSLRDAISSSDDDAAREVVIRWIRGFTGKEAKIESLN